METLKLLKEWTEAAGASGNEAPVAELIRAHWLKLADEVRSDALGNLIALKRGEGPEPRPAVMAAAHMDENALIVTGIEGQFLRVHRIGGPDRRVLLGSEVLVHAKRSLHGIIGARPPHVLPRAERNRVLPWEKIFVDVGLPEEEVAALVNVGDIITFNHETVALKNGRAAGKALDDRACVVAITVALEELQRLHHTWDFYAVATVQEEATLLGGATSAYGVAPQIGVALDVSFAKQHDDSGPGTYDLDGGPSVGLGPNFHPQVTERIRKTAEKEEMHIQIEPVPGHSGTDAWCIQVAREGIPTGLIEVPVRYMHQPVETVVLRDIERAGRLLAAFVAGLEPDFRPQWDDADPAQA